MLISQHAHAYRIKSADAFHATILTHKTLPFEKPCISTRWRACVCALRGCLAIARAYLSSVHQFSSASHPTPTDFHPYPFQISNTDIFRTKTPNSTKFEIHIAKIIPHSLERLCVMSFEIRNKKQNLQFILRN